MISFVVYKFPHGGMDHSVLITMHDSDQGPGLSGQSSMGDPGRQSGPASIAVPPVPPPSPPPLLRHEVHTATLIALAKLVI